MSVQCGYCGPGNVLPGGYDYFENRNVCLRKGFGSGASVERKKWQRKLGLPIDPPYVSPCPKRDRRLIRQVRRVNRRQNRRQQRSPPVIRYRSRSRSRSRSGNRPPPAIPVIPRRRGSRSRTPVIRSRSRTPVMRRRRASRSRTPVMRSRSRTPIMRRRSRNR